MNPVASLPEIPLLDIGPGGTLALLAAERTRVAALLEAGRRRHGRLALAIGDRISGAWLTRSGNPFGDEIRAVAAAVGVPGAILLNLSFEWCCTSGAAPDPYGPGNRLLRALDWPLDGLGRHVIVAREATPSGPFYNVTWPGSVGVLTAMAPGRFSAAINQAPMRRHGLTLAGDWLRNRVAVWRSRDLPPAHLLRQVFEAARDYREAKAMLCETRLALPALFTLSGTTADEGCVIERTEIGARVHPGPVACANAWLSDALGGRARGRDNAARRDALARMQARPSHGFAWAAPPVLNRFTRVAVEANAAQGALRVLGFEAQRPATAEFHWIH